MNDQILPQQGQPQAPSNFFETLVGEGKKFKDPEALAKSKWDSDEYIKTIERKMDNQSDAIRTLTEKLNSQANMQELLDLMKQQTQAQGEPPVKPQPPADNKPTQIDRNQIFEAVKELDAQKAEQSNLNAVQTKIKEKWGDNVPASVREQIEKLGELGVTMAKRYPDEFLRTIGAEQIQRQPSFQSPPRSDVNAGNFKPQGPQDRTWQWYEDLRKKDPVLYSSKKMTVQMHNDAMRLGEAFMDGDFNVDDRQLLASKYKN